MITDATTKELVPPREAQGRTNTHIPKKERIRQRNTVDPKDSTIFVMTQPTLEDTLLINNDFIVFFFVMVAKLVRRHALARHLMEGSMV